MCTYAKLSIALAIVSVTLLVSSASGQAPGSQRVGPEKEVNATRAGQPGNSENGVATPASRTSDLESDVAAMKADNAAVREQLRKMEEQQKALLELVERLQRLKKGHVR